MDEQATTETQETTTVEAVGTENVTVETVTQKTTDNTTPAMFTQTQVDEIVQKRIAREHAKVASQLSTEVDKAKAELTSEYETKLAELAQQAEQTRTQLETTQFQSAITIAALNNGSQLDQVEAFTKLITIDEVKNPETGIIETTKVEEAVKNTLTKFPGLAGNLKIGGSVASTTTQEPLSLADAISKKIGK